MWLATECTGSKAHARGAADKDGIHKRWAASAEHHQIHGKKKKKETTQLLLSSLMQTFRIKPKKLKSLLKGYLAVLKSLQGSNRG